MAPVKNVKTYSKSNTSLVNNSVDAFNVLFAKNMTKRLLGKTKKKNGFTVKELPVRKKYESLLADDSLHVSTEDTFDKLIKTKNSQIKSIIVSADLESPIEESTFCPIPMTRQRKKDLFDSAEEIDSFEKTHLRRLQQPSVERIEESLEVEKVEQNRRTSLSYIKTANKSTDVSNLEVSTRSGKTNLFESASSSQSKLVGKIDSFENTDLSSLQQPSVESLKVEKVELKPETSLNYITVSKTTNMSTEMAKLGVSTGNFTKNFRQKLTHCSTPILPFKQVRFVNQTLSPIKVNSLFKQTFQEIQKWDNEFPVSPHTRNVSDKNYTSLKNSFDCFNNDSKQSSIFKKVTENSLKMQEHFTNQKTPDRRETFVTLRGRKILKSNKKNASSIKKKLTVSLESFTNFEMKNLSSSNLHSVKDSFFSQLSLIDKEKVNTIKRNCPVSSSTSRNYYDNDKTSYSKLCKELVIRIPRVTIDICKSVTSSESDFENFYSQNINSHSSKLDQSDDSFDENRSAKEKNLVINLTNKHVSCNDFEKFYSSHILNGSDDNLQGKEHLTRVHSEHSYAKNYSFHQNESHPSSNSSSDEEEHIKNISQCRDLKVNIQNLSKIHSREDVFENFYSENLNLMKREQSKEAVECKDLRVNINNFSGMHSKEDIFENFYSRNLSLTETKDYSPTDEEETVKNTAKYEAVRVNRKKITRMNSKEDIFENFYRTNLGLTQTEDYSSSDEENNKKSVKLKVNEMQNSTTDPNDASPNLSKNSNMPNRILNVGLTRNDYSQLLSNTSPVSIEETINSTTDFSFKIDRTSQIKSKVQVQNMIVDVSHTEHFEMFYKDNYDVYNMPLPTISVQIPGDKGGDTVDDSDVIESSLLGVHSVRKGKPRNFETIESSDDKSDIRVSSKCSKKHSTYKSMSKISNSKLSKPQSEMQTKGHVTADEAFFCISDISGSISSTSVTKTTESAEDFRPRPLTRALKQLISNSKLPSPKISSGRKNKLEKSKFKHNSSSSSDSKILPSTSDAILIDKNYTETAVNIRNNFNMLKSPCGINPENSNNTSDVSLISDKNKSTQSNSKCKTKVSSKSGLTPDVTLPARATTEISHSSKTSMTNGKGKWSKSKERNTSDTGPNPLRPISENASSETNTHKNVQKSSNINSMTDVQNNRDEYKVQTSKSVDLVCKIDSRKNMTHEKVIDISSSIECDSPLAEGNKTLHKRKSKPKKLIITNGTNLEVRKVHNADFIKKVTLEPVTNNSSSSESDSPLRKEYNKPENPHSESKTKNVNVSLYSDDVVNSSVIDLDKDSFKMPKFNKSTKNILLKSGKSWRRSLSIYKRSSLFIGFPNEEGCNMGKTCPKGKLSRLPSQRCSKRLSVRFVPVKPIPVLQTETETTALEDYAVNTSYVPDQILEASLEDSFRCLSLNQSRSSIKSQQLGVPVTAKEIVLRKCGQTEPEQFSKCFPDNILQNCQKIGEGVYGEVFLFKNPSGGTSVLKIVPVEGDQMVNGERQKKFEEVLSEIIITIELSNLRKNKRNGISAFTEVQQIQCVQGRYPEKLLYLWDLYDETRGSENDCPDIFGDDQLYIIFQMAYGGRDLESFIFNGAMQAYSMFQQVALALAIAEEELHFEHRDLHWGNVLVSTVEANKMTSFNLENKTYDIPTMGVEVAIIDYTLSRIEHDGVVIFNDLGLDPDLFTADGDYQFEIYRLMQQKNRNNWKEFEPFSNLLWLDYILDKAIVALRYRNIKTKRHKEYLRKLKMLKEDILSYQNVKDFVAANLLEI